MVKTTDGINVLLIHGEKPRRNEKMHPEFINRLNKAVEITKDKEIDLIVITGGPTIKNVPSEAKIGKQYLQGKVDIPIQAESQSRTTSENIRFTKALLNSKQINSLTDINSKKRIRRTKYLFKRLRPEIYPKTNFISIQDYYNPAYRLVEIFYLFFAWLDPYERTFVRHTAKMFRNHT